MKTAPMTPEEAAKHHAARRILARQQAYGLGIALYLDESGRISQHGPGERIEPGKGAVPTPGIHGASAEAKTKP